MHSLAPHIIEILHNTNVAAARREAKAMAKTVGFEEKAREEIGLAVTELGTNLIKHGGGGKVTLTPLEVDGRFGLQLESCDQGPGIGDVGQAMVDRFSTTATRGAGLGAINRLMDDLEITSMEPRGTRVTVRKWLRLSTPQNRLCPFAFGVATRPRRFGEENGDAFVIKKWGEIALVSIIDGLGHGTMAHRAAEAARQYVERHYDLPLDEIFRGVGRACGGTRGVVMALARFDWGQSKLTMASVGNIEIRFFPRSDSFGFSHRRGVLGLNAPNALVEEFPLPRDEVFVMHSDGLATHWNEKTFPGLTDQSASSLAQELLKALAKEADDATVIVVRRLMP